MNVAIIGTGNMGAGLARLLACKGIHLSIGHRDPARAAALAQEIGEGVEGGGIAAVTALADMVILAVPFDAVPAVVSDAGPLAGKILVDITNPITGDYKALTIGHTTSAAEEIRKAAPEARVVKAFNTIFAAILPEATREDVAAVQVFIAGDDEGAKHAVADLARKAGFEPVEAGPLSNARLLEPIGEFNIHMGFFLGHGTSVAPAWIDTKTQHHGG